MRVRETSAERGPRPVCYTSHGRLRRSLCLRLPLPSAPPASATIVPRWSFSLSSTQPTQFPQRLSDVANRHLLRTRADMIRRPPTTIPLTDLDVQQVRDAVKLQKKQAGAQNPAQPKDAASASTTLAQPYHHVEEAKKKREGMTRDERLGLR